jgi:hypothetical protein
VSALQVFERALDRMGNNEIRAAQGAYEQRCTYAERVADAQANLRDALLSLVKGGDINAVAEFEPPCTDYRNRRGDGSYPSRPSTLFDVLHSTVDYRDYDRQLIALFVRAANGESIAADAQALMTELATHYGNANADVD